MARPFDDPVDPLVVVEITGPEDAVRHREPPDPAPLAGLGRLVDALARRPLAVLTTVVPLLTLVTAGSLFWSVSRFSAFDQPTPWRYAAYQVVANAPAMLTVVAAGAAATHRALTSTRALDRAEHRALRLVLAVEVLLVAAGIYAMIPPSGGDEAVNFRIDGPGRLGLAAFTALHLLGAALALGALRYRDAPTADDPPLARATSAADRAPSHGPPARRAAVVVGTSLMRTGARPIAPWKDRSPAQRRRRATKVPSVAIST